MKSLTIGFLILGTSPILFAQSFSLGINGGAQADYLTVVSGQVDSAATETGGNWYAGAEAAYHFTNGLNAYCEIGVQIERVGFIERIPGTGSPIYSKEYHTPVLAVGGGYQVPLFKSRFSIIMSAGFGIGYQNPTNMTDYYAIDKVYGWLEPQTGNTGTDTLHVLFDLRDLTEPGFNSQVRATCGVEYRKGHFFLKAFAETRVWLRRMAEVQYHIERMDTYYKYEMNYIADGHFTVRGGYLGIGIGTGWYFGAIEE